MSKERAAKIANSPGRIPSTEAEVTARAATRSQGGTTAQKEGGAEGRQGGGRKS